MPPLRTMPPAKVLKTERTHEENQERAYIAASRRSDRSLEARVESARRASEIHKRRTGRSLRVTEQDVVNEEMYEEEDDDLPMQYRRLTAHLQTGSADFNRRLSAYLTNHVAMRSALDQAVTNSYAQQYPNAPQFAHNQSFFPSPFAQSPTQAPSPQSVYSQPYPTPGTPGYRPSYHQRSSSHSVSQAGSNFAAHIPSPTPSSAPDSAVSLPSEQRHPSQSLKSDSRSPAQQRSSIPRTPQVHEVNGAAEAGIANGSSQQPSHRKQSTSQVQNEYPNLGPFSMALPMESQMLLNGALDPNDPMTNALMAGNNFPQAYNYGSPGFSKSRSFAHPFSGMSATLAPSALDMQPPQQELRQQQPAVDSMPLSSVAAPNFGLDQGDFTKGGLFPSSQESQASGAATPAFDAGWDAFINDNSWNESNVT